MRKLAAAYLKNALRARFTGSPWFDPMIATLYPTPMCNLSCSYCDDFGAQRNAGFRGQELDTARMKRVVEMLVEVADVLYITGGEPTMRQDLAELIAHARARGIYYVAMNTNGLLLREQTELMDLLDNLVISLDSLDEQRYDPILGGKKGTTRELCEIVRWAATEQRARGFTLTVNCVVMPGMVQDAIAVRDLCFEIGAQFSAQPQSIDRMPAPQLARDPLFHTLVDSLLEAKSSGGPVSGSVPFLRRTRELTPFQCTPTAAPHVDWRGHLAYPCRELPDHIWVDLLAAGSYRAALAEAERRWGAPPRDCSRCGERCYVEISTLVRHPTELVREAWGYLRQMGGPKHAPRAHEGAAVAPRA
jgi:MoaA/NifB/PqqE/SkfB family radical SAM enzyme